MQNTNDFSGVSQSTASAALALTALSAGNEDRQMTDISGPSTGAPSGSGGGGGGGGNLVIKHHHHPSSPPFVLPPLPQTNVYHHVHSSHNTLPPMQDYVDEYSKSVSSRQPLPRQPLFYPDAMDKANLKRKLPKK